MNKLNINEHMYFDVIGIGNAIVDILIKTNDSYLEELSLKKGSMTLIDEELSEKLYKKFGPGIETSGGSAANTLACIAQLGGKSRFIGRVRNDELGRKFSKQISAVGTSFKTPASKHGPSTARCIILVTPDAQRTMCTYLGASVYLEPEDLDIEALENSKILYLEGYLWDHPAAKNAFIEAAKIAKASNNKVSLSLSDAFCVKRHGESFVNLINNYVDILFANESEIKSLYKTSNLNTALESIQGKCEIAAVTLGDKGSVLLTKKDRISINPFQLGSLVDTTGAGDLYAGGFLKGFTEGLELSTCGEIGSICAGHIVTKLGPRTEDSISSIVKENLNKKDKST